MSESTERCCGNCQFFVPLANPHEHLPEDSPLRFVGNKQVGACHRYPPALGDFGWPILVEEDWCFGKRVWLRAVQLAFGAGASRPGNTMPAGIGCTLDFLQPAEEGVLGHSTRASA